MVRLIWFCNIYTVNFYIHKMICAILIRFHLLFRSDYRFLYPKEDRLLKSIIDKAIIGMDKDTLDAIMIKGQ